MKFSKKNFAPYAKNPTVQNIITINKFNVGMKSLDQAIIVRDTLKTETSPSFISYVRVSVPVPFPAPVPDSGFWLFHTPSNESQDWSALVNIRRKALLSSVGFRKRMTSRSPRSLICDSSALRSSISDLFDFW